MSGQLNIPYPVCFFLSSKTFEKLIHINYHSISTPSAQWFASENITEKEEDVLNYIAGCSIRKAKEKVMRKNKPNQAHIEILQSLKADEDDQSVEMKTRSLTQIHDRGGLTHVGKSLTTLFVYMEQHFRSAFSHNQFTVESYVTMCTTDSVITSTFYEITSDCDESEDDKLYILQQMLAWFFRLRMHSKCRTIIDKCQAKKNTSWKEKGLRRNLKKSDH